MISLVALSVLLLLVLIYIIKKNRIVTTATTTYVYHFKENISYINNNCNICLFVFLQDINQ